MTLERMSLIFSDRAPCSDSYGTPIDSEHLQKQKHKTFSLRYYAPHDELTDSDVWDYYSDFTSHGSGGIWIELSHYCNN